MEVALALVMVTSAGLLVRSLVHLQRVDPGFNASRVLTGTINLPQTEYTTPERWQAFNGELLGVFNGCRACPGPLSASACLSSPLR